jgi:hypothetical protein
MTASQASLSETINLAIDQGRLEPPEPDSYDCRDDLTLRYKNRDTGATAPYRCGQWDCGCCGYRQKQNLLEDIDRLLEQRPEMSRLLTLTVDASRWHREEAHAEIGAAWNRLRSNLKAAIGDFSYVWIREETDRGQPHLHVLVSRYLPQARVAAAWSSTGMGDVVDIRRVEARKAGHYLAKYLAKDAMRYMPDGVHRYGSSADIDLDVRESGGSSEDEWVVEAEDPAIDRWLPAEPVDYIPDTGEPP